MADQYVKQLDIGEGENAQSYTIKDAEARDLITQLNDILNCPNAGAHNSIYRGKYLGTSVTDAQYNAIEAGTFDDMYIGDYWTINGFDWVIADFDYWYRSGDMALTKHHILIVPSTILYNNTYMNATNTTVGGYQGSYMYTDGLTQAKSIINEAFGSAHIVNHRNWFTNAVTNGYPSAGDWVDSTVDLMNEEMVYGCPIRQQMSFDGTIVNNYTIDKSQLALFSHDKSAFITSGTHYPWWLRDVVSATSFVYAGNYGSAAYSSASYAIGVRPCFAICKS